MPFDVIHIVLLISIAILVVVIIYILTRLKNSTRAVEQKISRLTEKHVTEKTYLEKEIKRQEFIIAELKQRKNSKNRPDEISGNPEQENATSTIFSAGVNTTGQALVSSDETEFRDKNKKLWELSIAVHKEKDRIDKLKKEIEHRHNEVTKSITYAQRIQKALLPSSKILDVRFSDYFILWKPKDIVSGDFYWFKRIDDNLIIIVADCTGHGVPGAFMSLLGISFLNDLLNKDKNLKSYQILDKLREMIKLALQQELRSKNKAGDGIDMALCIINNKTLEMDFAGANNPLYLIRDNTIKIFKENKNPVGIHATEHPFESHTFQLRKEDKIYMFSDGLVDQFGGPHGRKFLKSNFQKILLYMAEQNLGMREEKEMLENTFHQWKGDKHPQIDDILVVGIKI